MVKVNTYRSPWVAAFWSIALPGFGQLYNRDYLIGFPLIIMEIFINTAANINLSIFYTFNGQFQKSYEVIDFQYALFYPSMIVFAAWQANNKAKSINRELKKQGEPLPEKITHHDGFFIGMLVGLILGLISNILESPIFSSLLGGTLGAILGLLIDNVFIKHSEKSL